MNTFRRCPALGGDVLVRQTLADQFGDRNSIGVRLRLSQGGEESALFTIRLDGSQERQVTSFALHAGDATWSPDGRTMALEASPTPTSRGDVYTVRPDGSQLRNLTRNDSQVAGSADPVWSPDGKFLLFLSETRTTDGDVTGGLTVMRANGTARRFVPATPMFEHQPDWRAIRR
ncbi:hypothetical protein KRR39_10490 [Nocardioides panacis]|uniref:Dipeptidylpeptidase IV N-terminal domain-containing protein n=1 Tax=Nocardioides panacis TaxID=2849501 RepID=A0A975Y225_9ACTN|nr:hypothetical protein [Nocardioides panacis]QWZ10117.1 hypothetical protein KRR39_10490 [Nocardioides panacis]